MSDAAPTPAPARRTLPPPRRNWDGSGGADSARTTTRRRRRRAAAARRSWGRSRPTAPTSSRTTRTRTTWSRTPSWRSTSRMGVDVMAMKKTEKTMTELQIDLNMNYDFSAITEEGEKAVPLSGPGHVGLKNLGNLHMNSVMQVRRFGREGRGRGVAARPRAAPVRRTTARDAGLCLREFQSLSARRRRHLRRRAGRASGGPDDADGEARRRAARRWRRGGDSARALPPRRHRETPPTPRATARCAAAPDARAAGSGREGRRHVGGARARRGPAPSPAPTARPTLGAGRGAAPGLTRMLKHCVGRGHVALRARSNGRGALPRASSTS